MAEFNIEAQPRTTVGKKVKRLRAAGLVPITVYGPKTAPMSLQVPYRPLEVALLRAGGTNVIDITADGKTVSVLARDVQRDVLKGTILHADFLVIDEATRITASIPVHLIGESPAVAAREGILIAGANSITIETLPSKLVNQIEVDLSELKKVGDSITIADLDLGEDITILDDPEDMLASVSQTSAARAELLEKMASGETDVEEVDAEVPEVSEEAEEEMPEEEE